MTCQAHTAFAKHARLTGHAACVAALLETGAPGRLGDVAHHGAFCFLSLPCAHRPARWASRPPHASHNILHPPRAHTRCHAAAPSRVTPPLPALTSSPPSLTRRTPPPLRPATCWLTASWAATAHTTWETRHAPGQPQHTRLRTPTAPKPNSFSALPCLSKHGTADPAPPVLLISCTPPTPGCLPRSSFSWASACRSPATSARAGARPSSHSSRCDECVCS